MKTLNTVVGVAVLLCAASGSRAELPAMPGSAYSRQASVLLHPDLYSGIGEVEGKVLTVNLDSRVIALKDFLGHILEIHVASDTPINDSSRGRVELADLTENETVHIYFDTRDMTARQVDRVTRGIWGEIWSAS